MGRTPGARVNALPGHPLDGPEGMVPRRIAIAVWGGMLAMLLLLAGVVLAIENPGPSGGPVRLLFWLSVATSAVGIVLSRVLPPRIPAHQAGGRPAANAMTRLIVGWSLCEGVAIFPLVAHMVVHDHRLLWVFAADVLALAMLYPSENAWAHLSAEEASGRAERGEP